MDAAEQQHRLHRMESHEGTLVDEEEHQSGQPAQHITQQGGNVLLHTGFRGLAVTGGRRIIAGWRGRRRGISLAGRRWRGWGVTGGVHGRTAAFAKIGRSVVVSSTAGAIGHNGKPPDINIGILLFTIRCSTGISSIPTRVNREITEMFSRNAGLAGFEDHLSAGNGFENLYFPEPGRFRRERVR